MARVLCTLPNASDLISGVKFEPSEDPAGMLSVHVDPDVAEQFAAVPGYVVTDSGPVPVAPIAAAAPAVPAAPIVAEPAVDVVIPPAADAQASAEPAAVAPTETAAADETGPADAEEGADAATVDKIEALRAEATSLGIKVNMRWAEARLTAEIEAAKASRPADPAT